MPPRDEQDYAQRRQQIIHGALEAFASKGFEKATNKDIAEAAGIGSPGLIYHYFKDKADLLGQVLEEHSPAMQFLANPDSLEHFMTLPPREALTIVAHKFLKTLENPIAIAAFKLLLGESIRQPAVAAVFNRLGPGRGIPVLSQYLLRQMELGTMRRMEPGAAARCLMGPLLAYFLTRDIFVQPDTQTFSAETMAETVIDIFLHGMLVEGQEPAPPPQTQAHPLPDTH